MPTSPMISRRRGRRWPATAPTSPIASRAIRSKWQSSPSNSGRVRTKPPASPLPNRSRGQSRWRPPPWRADPRRGRHLRRRKRGRRRRTPGACRGASHSRSNRRSVAKTIARDSRRKLVSPNASIGCGNQMIKWIPKSQGALARAWRRLFRAAVVFQPVIFLPGVPWNGFPDRAVPTDALARNAIPEVDVLRHRIAGEGFRRRRKVEREAKHACGGCDSRRQAGIDGHDGSFLKMDSPKAARALDGRDDSGRGLVTAQIQKIVARGVIGAPADLLAELWRLIAAAENDDVGKAR